MHTNLKISVVIPAYNEERSIERCLLSLTSQTRMADEIIVVDNNSKDATASIAARYARVVTEPKQGIGPTRTRGFDEASGDIIVRVDADAVAAPDCLAAYEAAFLSDPELIAAGGMPLSRDALKKGFMRWTGYLPAFFAGIDRNLVKRIPILYGFNFAVRKTAWTECREDIIACDSILNEDIEVSYILYRAGKTAYIPQAKVFFEMDDMSPLKLGRYLIADLHSMRRNTRRKKANTTL